MLIGFSFFFTGLKSSQKAKESLIPICSRGHLHLHPGRGTAAALVV